MRAPLERGKAVLALAALLLLVAGVARAALNPDTHVVSPAGHTIESGRVLGPGGKLVQLGNFPAGGAVTADGRFYWTVSAGWSQNDVRIVSLRKRRVIQTIKLPGASGGVALDSARGLAYISGEPDTDIKDVKTHDGTPGKQGDVIHVFAWNGRTGLATPTGVIPVPAPPDAPAPQSFPPDPTAAKRSWPMGLAVSADGGTLLAALELGDAAAIVDTKTKAVRYVDTGSYPYGAAILPDGKTGLVSNQGPGTVSVIDLGAGKKTKDIQAGPHLSHPESIALDPARQLAYVPLANADSVAVIDTAKLELDRRLSTARREGEGTAPVDAALSPDRRQLLVAESAANEVAVFALPPLATPRKKAKRPTAHKRRRSSKQSEASRRKRKPRREKRGAPPKPFTLVGRIATAEYPTDVDSIGASAQSRCDRKARKRRRKKGRRKHVRAHHSAKQPHRRKRRRAKKPAVCPKLVWTAAKGFGLGPNAGPPFTSQYFDIPTAYSTKNKVTGYAGVLDFPKSASELARLTRAAGKQLVPSNAQAAPPGTPLRPGGPIKHVFYIVRENRTYDQVLGDAAGGDGDPRYAIFGKRVTPNIHAMVQRFPLLDRFYANSEASIDGHYWTAAANNSDYVHKTWRENYAGRGYPSDAWFFQIAFPQSGFIFDRADEQGVSWINLGEGVIHLNILPGDKDRSDADQQGVTRRYSKSDLGALTPGGCYDPFIGSDDIVSAAKVPTRIYDSSKPLGAPEPSLSRVDCFRLRFQRWVTEGSLPSLVYMTLPNDHTNGAAKNHHTPRAMVADNDLALGQVLDTISHSPYWKDSAVFVVEDDSQDGMDHQDAHRIPALVASPYAKRGVALHTRYDFPSVLHSVELILGLKPLNLFDATATPMYDAFNASPGNSEPYNAVPATYPLLEENPSNPTSATARRASGYNTHVPDHISQRLLDEVLWKSVHGPRSKPPPPGPNAQPDR